MLTRVNTQLLRFQNKSKFRIMNIDFSIPHVGEFIGQIVWHLYTGTGPQSQNMLIYFSQFRDQT